MCREASGQWHQRGGSTSATAGRTGHTREEQRGKFVCRGTGCALRAFRMHAGALKSEAVSAAPVCAQIGAFQARQQRCSSASASWRRDKPGDAPRRLCSPSPCRGKLGSSKNRYSFEAGLGSALRGVAAAPTLGLARRCAQAAALRRRSWVAFLSRTRLSRQPTPRCSSTPCAGALGTDGWRASGARAGVNLLLIPQVSHQRRVAAGGPAPRVGGPVPC